jgi:ubiquitin-conjugating enzyme E2 J1
MSNLNMQRIMKEKKELETNPPSQFLLYPMEDDVFEWHFTLLGTEDSDYAGGLYHGRILLPKNYPLSPPDLIFMTVGFG